MSACRRLVPRDLPAVTRMFNAAVDAGEATADVAHRSIEQVDSWLGAPAPTLESFVVEGSGRLESGESGETSASSESGASGETSAGLVAWASLTRHHERAAYGPTAELSVYVAPGARRRGLGFELASHMVERARARSLHSLVMLLFAHRPDATRLAEKLAFSRVGTLAGVYPRVDAGAGWLDVTLWQLSLASRSDHGTRSGP